MDNRVYEVLEVTQEVAKHGVSKAGKDWSMASVRIEGGREVNVFNPVKVGDKLQVEQNGQYENWKVVKPDPKHEEIMAALRAIYKAVSPIPTIVQGDTIAATKPPVKPDTPLTPEEEVSLDDIPF